MKYKKATCQDLYRLGVEFFAAHDVIHNVTKAKAVRYILDKPLTSEQKAELECFDNVMFSTCKHQYAPEIIHETIILMA